MPTAVLIYDQAPPTSNKNNGVGGRGQPHAIAKTKRLWANIWGSELMRARVPRGCRFVRVRPLVEYQTKGRRDSDNMYFPISKPLGDVLVSMDIIPDDDPKHYACERPEIMLGVTGLNPRTKSRVTLHLEYE